MVLDLREKKKRRVKVVKKKKKKKRKEKKKKKKKKRKRIVKSPKGGRWRLSCPVPGRPVFPWRTT